MKYRVPAKLSPESLQKLKILQGKIKAITGEEPSLPDLLDRIMKDENFIELEKRLTMNKLNLRMKFD